MLLEPQQFGDRKGGEQGSDKIESVNAPFTLEPAVFLMLCTRKFMARGEMTDLVFITVCLRPQGGGQALHSKDCRGTCYQRSVDDVNELVELNELVEFFTGTEFKTLPVLQQSSCVNCISLHLSHIFTQHPSTLSDHKQRACANSSNMQHSGGY